MVIQTQSQGIGRNDGPKRETLFIKDCKPYKLISLHCILFHLGYKFDNM